MDQVSRERIDPSRLVFIGRDLTKTNMAPLRCWRRRQRIKAKLPHGHCRTMTFLAALRHDRITAPGSSRGRSMARPSNSTSRRFSSDLAPGDIVIMDNLGSHKGKAVRRAIRAVRRPALYLPKYYLLPSEPDRTVLRQFKHWLREAAMRTTEAVYNAIRSNPRHRLSSRMCKLLR